jgi:hypothetical protein
MRLAQENAHNNVNATHGGAWHAASAHQSALQPFCI